MIIEKGIMGQGDIFAASSYIMSHVHATYTQNTVSAHNLHHATNHTKKKLTHLDAVETKVAT